MREVRLGPRDAGRTVAVAAGDRLVIALPETASSGYRWTVEELPRGARIVEDRYEHPSGAPLGSASLHLLVLEGAYAGVVRLRQSRSGRREDDDRFEVSVTER